MPFQAWLSKLLPLLHQAKRREPRSLAAYHFAMEAGIKAQEDERQSFQEIGAIAPLREVAGVPDELPDVIVNSAQGNSLNQVVESDSEALMTVQKALKEVCLPTFGIAQSQPSLDDVYLAATGRTIMDAEVAAASKRDMKKEMKRQNMKR